MRIASFGDVHLGPSPKRDRFCHTDDDLLEFSEHLQDTHDRAVLVGDVFQADWGWRLGPCTREVDQILRRYERVWRVWAEPFFEMIAGNHDRVIGEHLGAGQTKLISENGINVLYLHGDRYDKAINGRAPDVTMWIVGRLRDLAMRRTADVIEDLLLQPGSIWINGGDPIQRAADQLGTESGSQVIVAGHTHCAVCASLQHVVYANSGAFSPKSRQYVSVDTEASTVELRSYEAGGRVSVVERVSVNKRRPPVG